MLVGMASLTHRERIVQALRLSPRPLDDDQLSQRTQIRPRQAVNQACRALERAGVLRRYQGPDRKIVNELASAPADTPSAPDASVAASGHGGSGRTILSRATDHAVPPGSSREQRDAERVMLDLLGAELDRSLEPATLTVPAGARVEVDGADTERSVLVECWAHQGNPKAAQRHKVSPTR